MTPLLSRFPLSCRLSMIVIFGIAAGCRKASEKPSEPPPAPVEVEEAKWITYGETTELIGTTQPLPNRLAQISTGVDGRVLTVLPKNEGKEIHEGDNIDTQQIVVQLDDRIPRANRAKLAASLLDLEEQINQAQYAIDSAQIDVKRLNELDKSRSATAIVPAVSWVEIAKAAVALKDATSKKESAVARAAAARAELAALDTQLAYYALRAPFAGQLSLVRAVPGQNLTAGTAVAEVVNLDEVDVLCNVPPRVVQSLKVDQDASLVVDDRNKGKVVFEGKVVFVDTKAQAETGNFAVKVRFPNKDGVLRANTIVHVRVTIEEEFSRLCVPESALMEDTDPPTLVVVEEKEENGKKVTKASKVKAVELGARDRHKLHVVQLLSLEAADNPNEKVDIAELKFVVKGAAGLQDDDEVEVKESEEKKEKTEK